MTSLMYSNSQDNLVTRKQLSALVTPEPLGPRHAPYPFVNFVGEIQAQLESAKYHILEEEFAVTKDENRLFGLLKVAPEAKLPVTQDWSLMVGLRGSHDRSIPRGITLGSSVMVCSNLCFHGDLGVWKSKQTLNMVDRLPGMIKEAVDKLPIAAKALTISFDKYRKTNVRQMDGDKVLCQIYRKGGFSASQLGRAIHEWDEPSHIEHADDGFTAWRLFNAATQALKPTGTRGQMLDIQQRSEIAYQVLETIVH